MMQEIFVIAEQAWVLWMMLLFLGICAWALWPRNKERLESFGRIPLDDDDDAPAEPDRSRDGRKG